ncbi:hypothetical protein [Aridibaculum aurantiacum]|uniref:hypothetical protein n=1 Tax=Aridibaculum aurantiacum TaxID=2810307 RepID=UPI001A9571B2|nr:hypothetical protein [Aridibaculum aurantiacum]
MKAITLAVSGLCLVLMHSVSFAQTKHPFKNIPVTDVSGTFTNATITITDFVVKDNQLHVASTLQGYLQGQPVSIPSYEKVNVVSATCEQLLLEIGAETVVLSGNDFNIGTLMVTLNKKHNDQQLNNTLCSIAHLQNTNASLHVLAAKLKQLIRGLV